MASPFRRKSKEREVVVGEEDVELEEVIQEEKDAEVESKKDAKVESIDLTQPETAMELEAVDLRLGQQDQPGAVIEQPQKSVIVWKTSAKDSSSLSFPFTFKEP